MMAENTCPKCGKQLGPNTIICMDCGINIKTGELLQAAVDPEGPDVEEESGPTFGEQVGAGQLVEILCRLTEHLGELLELFQVEGHEDADVDRAVVGDVERRLEPEAARQQCRRHESHRHTAPHRPSRTHV